MQKLLEEMTKFQELVKEGIDKMLAEENATKKDIKVLAMKPEKVNKLFGLDGDYNLGKFKQYLFILNKNKDVLYFIDFKDKDVKEALEEEIKEYKAFIKVFVYLMEGSSEKAIKEFKNPMKMFKLLKQLEGFLGKLKKAGKLSDKEMQTALNKFPSF